MSQFAASAAVANTLYFFSQLHYQRDVDVDGDMLTALTMACAGQKSQSCGLASRLSVNCRCARRRRGFTAQLNSTEADLRQHPSSAVVESVAEDGRPSALGSRRRSNEVMCAMSRSSIGGGCRRSCPASGDIISGGVATPATAPGDTSATVCRSQQQHESSDDVRPSRATRH